MSVSIMNKFNPVLLPVLVAMALLFSAIQPVFASGESADAGMKQVTVKQVTNLVADGREAGKKQVPVLIMFAMENCGFCHQVEEDFLKPMLRNADYDNKVLIRKVVLDSGHNVIDFKGHSRGAGELGDTYHVSVTPTLILFDANGKQLSAPIVGLANPYYYGGELDAAIDSSLQKIRAIAQR